MSVTKPPAEGRQRIDRWLWAARFFKSRSLARKALELGRVEVNGARARPARAISVGDRLEIRCPAGLFTVVVEALNLERRPASEARQLYTETAESRQAREREQAARRGARSLVAFDAERPDRRTRRAAIRARRQPPALDDEG